MDLKKLENITRKPPLYEKGDSIMWTDKHISKQLLELHLNPEIELASRTKPAIDKTIEFILKQCNRPGLKILDLGCGPGIYAERLAEAGHHVTGLDFSETSIEHASNQAKIKNLPIDYFCKDYLTIDYKDEFDVVLLIYTDFGVLIPTEREKLLDKIHKALKSTGIFVFDVINKKNMDEKFQEKKTWAFESGGFWKDTPYLELTSGFNYKEKNVFLQQHIIIDESAKVQNYRFWTHYFDNEDVIKIMKDNGFSRIEDFANILPESNIWNGENITFYKSVK